MKTYSVKADDIQRDWIVLDATGVPIGRLAAEAAKILRGKTKAIFSPHLDCGDHVIIINAEKVVLTGRKAEKKIRYRHSMFPGGLKAARYGDLLKSQPERTLRDTIWGMLPHNRLGRKMIKKLRVYRGASHPHQAQLPEKLEIEA